VITLDTAIAIDLIVREQQEKLDPTGRRRARRPIRR
jgi:hypothetical protein